MRPRGGVARLDKWGVAIFLLFPVPQPPTPNKLIFGDDCIITSYNLIRRANQNRIDPSIPPPIRQV